MDRDTIKAAMMGDAEAAIKCTEAEYLLPCPFCGGSCKIVSADGFGHIVMCGKCSHYRSPWSDNKKNLILMHNIRTNLRELMKGAGE